MKPSSSGQQSNGVKILLGDPKKAIFRLGLPMIIAMFFHTVYHLTDAIWVSGLGPHALSAVGFFFPFFMLIVSLAVGLGIGGGSAVSRYIGAKNKQDADSVAVHTLICMAILTISFTLPFIALCKPIFAAMGAGEALDMTVTYAQIMFGGSIFMFFTNISNALLRAEGDAKRAMYAMLAGSILNIVLDPIFIYLLNLGIAGAAWATIISMTVVGCILFVWLFLDKNTYLTFKFRGFRFRKIILLDIMKVGLPSSISQMSMSLMMLFVNLILVRVDSNGVAVFSTGWRLVMLAVLPIFGIATAVTSVCGAAFGAKDYQKLNAAFTYAIKAGVIIETVLAIVTFIFAPYITRIFTWSSKSAMLYENITLFIRIICLFFPAATLGIVSSSMFQGVGKGINSLIITVIRTIVLIVPFSWFFGIVLNMGLPGVWIGMSTGTWVAVIIAFIWAKMFIRRLYKPSR